MGYAMEYALMSDIYDALTDKTDSPGELSPAREGEMKDYIDTHSGFGAKFRAGIRFILNKAYLLLQKLIALIPSLIIKFQAKKEGDKRGISALYYKLIVEVRNRMSFIGKDINTILYKTNRNLYNLKTAVIAKDYHGISEINNGLDKSAEDIRDKVNFAHKYITDSARKLLEKAWGDDEFNARGGANDLMQEAISNLGIDKLLEENLEMLKSLQGEVKTMHEFHDPPNYDKNVIVIRGSGSADANIAAGTLRCIKCIDKILNAVATFGTIRE